MISDNDLLDVPTIIENEEFASLDHSTRNRKKSQISRSWTIEEDQLLKEIASSSKKKVKWHVISHQFKDRTAQQLMNRWNKVINPNLVKGNWTKEEDEILKNWVKSNGEIGWTKVAAKLPGRIGKQCRERWVNCLDPKIKKTDWTDDEDSIIIELQEKIGNKWAKIAEMLPGRTDNMVKNRWNSILKRKSSNFSNKIICCNDETRNIELNDDNKAIILKNEDQFQNVDFDIDYKIEDNELKNSFASYFNSSIEMDIELNMNLVEEANKYEVDVSNWSSNYACNYLIESNLYLC